MSIRETSHNNMHKEIDQFKTIIPIVLALLLLVSMDLYAIKVPELRRRVNDVAGMISPYTEKQLNKMLADLEQTDSTQIVVLTILSLWGDNLEDFSTRTAKAWGIGQKGKDKGSILLIVKRDRRIHIEVGYGLEGRLTDLVAGSIIRNTISPRLREGNFDQGVMDGVSAMASAVRGEYTVNAPLNRDEQITLYIAYAALGLLPLIIVLYACAFFSKILSIAAGAVLAPGVGFIFGANLFVILILMAIGISAGWMAGIVMHTPLKLGMWEDGKGGYYVVISKGWTGIFSGGFFTGGGRRYIKGKASGEW